MGLRAPNPGVVAVKYSTNVPGSGGEFNRLTIPANSQGSINVGGNYIFLLASPCVVSVRPSTGRTSDLHPLGAIRTTVEFGAVFISNPTSVAITIVVWVGYDEPAYARTWPQGTIIGPFEGLVTIAQTGVPQQLVASSTMFLQGTLYGFSAMLAAGGGTNNQNNVYVGNSAQYQPNTLAQGGSLSSGNWDLSAIWIIGTAGDGVFYSVA